jgi:hypothetical protein
MRDPQMSGHCAFPETTNPDESHERCQRQGAGSRANPEKEFMPCPCPCHFPEDRFECECGGTLAEAPSWPDEDAEYEGRDPEMVYTHVSVRTGRATGFECLPG